jgi:hypothetical protein
LDCAVLGFFYPLIGSNGEKLPAKGEAFAGQNEQNFAPAANRASIVRQTISLRVDLACRRGLNFALRTMLVSPRWLAHLAAWIETGTATRFYLHNAKEQVAFCCDR